MPTGRFLLGSGSLLTKNPRTFPAKVESTPGSESESWDTVSEVRLIGMYLPPQRLQKTRFGKTRRAIFLGEAARLAALFFVAFFFGGFAMLIVWLHTKTPRIMAVNR